MTNTIGKLNDLRISKSFNNLKINENTIIPLLDSTFKKHKFKDEAGNKWYQIKIFTKNGITDYITFLNKHDRDFVWNIIVEEMEFGENIFEKYIDENY